MFYLFGGCALEICCIHGRSPHAGFHRLFVGRSQLYSYPYIPWKCMKVHFLPAIILWTFRHFFQSIVLFIFFKQISHGDFPKWGYHHVPSNPKSSCRHDQVLKPMPTWGSPAAAKPQQLSSEVPLAEACGTATLRPWWLRCQRGHREQSHLGHYHLVILGNMPKYYMVMLPHGESIGNIPKFRHIWSALVLRGLRMTCYDTDRNTIIWVCLK